jgi:preprotein translocase subunit SecD
MKVTARLWKRLEAPELKQPHSPESAAVIFHPDRAELLLDYRGGRVVLLKAEDETAEDLKARAEAEAHKHGQKVLTYTIERWNEIVAQIEDDF